MRRRLLVLLDAKTENSNFPPKQNSTKNTRLESWISSHLELQWNVHQTGERGTVRGNDEKLGTSGKHRTVVCSNRKEFMFSILSLENTVKITNW